MGVPYDILDDLKKAEYLISECSMEDSLRKNRYFLNRLRDIGSDLELLIEEIQNNV